tara:strand:- start:3899 stop:4453 length:555 start_codon:yes stop_codon:yes gene_type:complete
MHTQIFSKELEKIAQAKRKVSGGDIAKGLLAQGAGFTAGYGTAKYVYPAILKRMGKKVKPISGKSAALLGFMSGLGVLGAHMARRRYEHVNYKKRNDKRKNRKNSAGLSNNKQLAQRLQGHSPKVPERLLRPNASRPVPVSRNRVQQRGVNSRGRDGNYNIGRSDDKYKYRGKKTRNYRFSDPI